MLAGMPIMQSISLLCCCGFMLKLVKDDDFKPDSSKDASSNGVKLL